ncbi:MAG: ANTAR domain-containing protein [Actinomycetes bacterium]
MSEEKTRDHAVPIDDVQASDHHDGATGFTPADEPSDVQGLSELVAQLRAENAALRAEVSQFREAMTTRGVIEQAKGILGWQSHHDPEEMFGVLASVSQASNLKVRAVAELVVERATHGEEVPLDVLRRALIDAARRRTPEGRPQATETA